MKFQYNDGGRNEAGYKGKAGDCVVRAIAIAANLPYQQVYDDLYVLNNTYAESRRGRVAKRLKRSGTPRNGNFKDVYHNYILGLGFTWTPTMFIGQGCKVHLIADELPAGRLIVQVSRHLTTVIDGVIHDTFNPCRADADGCAGSWVKVENGIESSGRIGERCVYGYYKGQTI